MRVCEQLFSIPHGMTDRYLQLVDSQYFSSSVDCDPTFTDIIVISVDSTLCSDNK